MEELNRILFSTGPLVCGWVLDRIFADPSWLPHVVVGYGKIISFLEKHLNIGKHKLFKGGLMTFTLVVNVFCLTMFVLRMLTPFPQASFILETILIFYCLAGKTLNIEVRKVFESFNYGIAKARLQIGRIVGRDTASLTETEIKTAALETLSENLSDGVIGPLFWYMILGLPGMMAYKMVNTLDSMVGYKNERYREFGCISARLDDMANYIPARLTALLIAMIGKSRRSFKYIFKYGHCHASPNSGYPEAALAGVLDCRFGGTHSYFGKDVYKPYIGERNRNLDKMDLMQSLRICLGAEITMVIIVAVFRTLIL